jgi:hypothetical protein
MRSGHSKAGVQMCRRKCVRGQPPLGGKRRHRTVQQHPPDCCCCTFCPGVMVDDLAAPDGVEVEPILRVWGLGRGLLRKAEEG